MDHLRRPDYPMPYNEGIFGETVDNDFPLRVLLVEDEEELAEEIAGELKAHWVEVNHVSSASYAIRATRKEKFDCLVLDYKLLSGTGLDIVRDLRSDKTNPNFKTPIIMASGALTKQDLIKLKGHVEKVMAKPYSISDLHDSIKEVVNQQVIVNDAAVLLIEDEEGLAEEIVDEFEDEGVQMTHVISADAAFMQTKKQKYNCIIVDINLAIGKGDEFIERVRLDAHNPNWETPIIVASSQISKALVSKISSYIQGATVKPYKIRELYTKVRPYLSESVRELEEEP